MWKTKTSRSPYSSSSASYLVYKREEQLERLEMEMRQAAKDLNFEAAADLRDMIMELKGAYK